MKSKFQIAQNSSDPQTPAGAIAKKKRGKIGKFKKKGKIGKIKKSKKIKKIKMIMKIKKKRGRGAKTIAKIGKSAAKKRKDKEIAAKNKKAIKKNKDK
jgi:hypothetical protein